MLGDGPPNGFNAEGVASEFGPHPALEVAWGHSVVPVIVADGPVEAAPAGFFMMLSNNAEREDRLGTIEKIVLEYSPNQPRRQRSSAKPSSQASSLVQRFRCCTALLRRSQ